MSLRLVVGVLSGLACIWLFGVDVSSVNPPPNAMVLLDPLQNVYFSPPLIDSDHRQFLASASLAAAVANGSMPATPDDERAAQGYGDSERFKVWIDLRRQTYYSEPPADAIMVNAVNFAEARHVAAKPDPAHKQAGGFFYSRSAFNAYLEKWGLRRARWSSSGQWNW